MYIRNKNGKIVHHQVYLTPDNHFAYLSYQAEQIDVGCRRRTLPEGLPICFYPKNRRHGGAQVNVSFDVENDSSPAPRFFQKDLDEELSGLR